MYMQGEIIAAKLPSGIEHYGIVTGLGTVISASKRTGFVLEECIETFSGGHHVVSIGYPSTLNPIEVISQARTFLGRKWNLFFDNCQHFATECHGEKKSPQLQAAFGACVVLALIYLYFSNK